MIAGDDVRGACHTNPALVGRGRRHPGVNTNVSSHTTTAFPVVMDTLGVGIDTCDPQHINGNKASESRAWVCLKPCGVSRWVFVENVNIPKLAHQPFVSLAKYPLAKKFIVDRTNPL